MASLSLIHGDSATSPRFSLTSSSYWLGLAIKVNIAILCENIATVYSCTFWGFPHLLWGLGHMSNAQHFMTTSEPNICKSWWKHLLNSHTYNIFSSFSDSFYTVFSCNINFLLNKLKNPLTRKCSFLRNVIPVKISHCRVTGNTNTHKKLGWN